MHTYLYYFRLSLYRTRADPTTFQASGVHCIGGPHQLFDNVRLWRATHAHLPMSPSRIFWYVHVQAETLFGVTLYIRDSISVFIIELFLSALLVYGM